MIEPLPSDDPKIVGFKLSGKMHDADYKTFVPIVEAALAGGGKVRLLVLFEDFHGWDLQALWDDIKFSGKHSLDIERIALVGDETWERWMASLCRPFTSAKVRYFDSAHLTAAWAWLREGD